MAPLDLVRLTPLMACTRGSPDVVIGLIDGPVLLDHLSLAGSRIREVAGARKPGCSASRSTACLHGTFVAGILSARRGSAAPAICPDCTLLVRPIFAETAAPDDTMPTARPEELAGAILDCVEAGARLLNISAAIAQPAIRSEPGLEKALSRAAGRGAVVVAAAGNQAAVGSTTITRHPWVIPVVATDLRGRPMGYSNLSNSIGRHGLGAPGDRITSLGTGRAPMTLQGTSAAAPFVTGAIALLWSAFPSASASAIRFAIARQDVGVRNTLAPPLLDAWGAYRILFAANMRRRSLG